ncbi:NAD-dependent epimerase/dehydratase family protein [Dinghuibacter silviterrae]|uniref:NAD-dependent epimerase/dehydratase family protein n=1 Tax=Dinghuibacter silviterrae TaxID=1539049 RepID=A0A4R8DF07_9BACT|nr:NAD-dependent epimerase/dehydratase family protein [Dinghuibacter silviterrae]TDW96159.1 NAD-dependent epimerase/dehydratase family protein [Dinghuibacter silviterrae]
MTDIKAIITGATGMVGEGVLHVCLQDPRVSAVLVINRKPLGIQHPKLREVIHADFFDLSAIESLLRGYNACFFCLGVSSVGMKEPDYYRVTHTLTLNVATSLVRLNPDMTFCYISGAGTDSSEKGRSMWARVKGKTENDLLQLPFRRAFALRPGFIKPIPGLQNAHSFYNYINWLFPLGRALYPSGFCTLTELGRAMIHLAEEGYDKKILSGKDIIALGK